MSINKIHYFNPGHEAAVLNASPYYQLPANPLKMQKDLEFLVAWYGIANDFALVEQHCDSFFKQMSDYFPHLPKAITKQELIQNNSALSQLEISLWGNSPQSIHFFNQLNAEFHLNLKIPIWNDTYKKLCSRRTAQTCLQSITSSIANISSEIIPSFYNNVEKIEKIAANDPVSWVIKSPYSSSGRGLIWINDGVLRPSSRSVLKGMLNKQSEVSLEKALDKQTDFAMLFYCEDDGNVNFRGYSLFQTDSKGNYKGNYICSQKQIINKISESIDASLLEQVKQQLIIFSHKEIAPYYSGCICVDMMIYRENGRLCLHPCVEINLRCSMGWIALHLYQHYFEGNTCAYLQIEFKKNPGETYQKHIEKEALYPLIIQKGRVKSGYMPLCPVTKMSNYSAFILTI